MESEPVRPKSSTSTLAHAVLRDDNAIIEADSFPASGDKAEDSGVMALPHEWQSGPRLNTVESSVASNASDEESHSTKSLTSSVYAYHKENGRTYHGYRSGTYPFPNDASEMERLDFQYVLVSHLLGDKPHLAPITSPRHVLDIGTGTGTWAIEMGDMYPDATIEATDLSPIQPTAVPSNVQFLIDDAEQADWAVPLDHYDLIHTRIMAGCFEDFKEIIEHAFAHLKPGGWMESQEVMSSVQCDDGTVPDDWPFKEWIKHLDEAAMTVGRPLRIANKLKRWYTEAGFVDVQEKVIKIPLNRWPKDPGLKEVGSWWQQNMLRGIQGFSLAHFTRVLGWSKDELEVYLVDVRKSLADRHVHAYHNLHVVWGRKPEASGST